MQEKGRYFLIEKGQKGNCIIAGTLQECEERAKQLRTRNKNDKYDEYWHNVPLQIIKEISQTEVVKEI